MPALSRLAPGLLLLSLLLPSTLHAESYEPGPDTPAPPERLHGAYVDSALLRSLFSQPALFDHLELGATHWTLYGPEAAPRSCAIAWSATATGWRTGCDLGRPLQLELGPNGTLQQGTGAPWQHLGSTWPALERLGPDTARSLRDLLALGRAWSDREGQHHWRFERHPDDAERWWIDRGQGPEAARITLVGADRATPGRIRFEDGTEGSLAWRGAALAIELHGQSLWLEVQPRGTGTLTAPVDDPGGGGPWPVGQSVFLWAREGERALIRIDNRLLWIPAASVRPELGAPGSQP